MHQTFDRENRSPKSIPPLLTIETLRNTGNVLALQGLVLTHLGSSVELHQEPYEARSSAVGFSSMMRPDFIMQAAARHAEHRLDVLLHQHDRPCRSTG